MYDEKSRLLQIKLGADGNDRILLVDDPYRRKWYTIRAEIRRQQSYRTPG